MELIITIAEKLNSIFARFGIEKKVVAITTDNASEFVLALIKFGTHYVSYEPFMESRDDDYIWYGEEEPFFENEEDAMEAIPLAEFVRMNDDVVPMKPNREEPLLDATEPSPNDSSHFVIHEFPVGVAGTDNGSIPIDFVYGDRDVNDTSRLPPRVACSAHTLNLIAKSDSFDALLDESYSTTYYRSNSNADVVAEILERKITKPHRIRWNKIYDAVSIQTKNQ